ncbi:MAG TPA: FAD-dependent oxidoreductase, partial [Patescibacteria group bacterium]|nr:FAD-dependent oxidoreductase [Patescibacteria group bacterium]
CFSPCQDACSRVDVDQAVAIRALKKFVADVERKGEGSRPKQIPKTHKEKVAIVGAGPAGLMAAYELAKFGYPVTVFERMSEPGGMMRYGIPGFRLEKAIVAEEIDYIKALGVDLKTGVALGKDISIESLRKDGYKAVFLAIGTWVGMKLGIPGENLIGVVNAVDFLRDIALGKPVEIGERIAVVGGGNSAIDAARTAKRCGAKEVVLLYRRSREEMPALPSEVAEAEKDGVKINLLVTPKQIIGEGGKVRAVECLRMKLGDPDESGRRRPVPVEGSEHKYEVDMVIPALGQVAETPSIPDVLIEKQSRSPLIQADPYTLETKIPGVFAGGDIVTGPASIIEAVAAGKKAARSIDLYLTGKDFRKDRDEKVVEASWIKNKDVVKKKEARYDVGEEAPRTDLEETLDRMETVEKDARWEACRCLGCGPCAECLGNTELCEADKAIVDADLCIGCNVCAVVCPFDAVRKNEDNVAEVDTDLCKGCGICAARCPTRAISMEKMTDERIRSLTTLSCKE